MFRYTLTFAAATAAALFLLGSTAPSPAEAICEHFGAKCGKDTPCCFNGYCDKKPKFCSVGCDKANSYSEKSCYPRPNCVNYQSSFTDSKRLINQDDYDGSPLNYDWTSDFKPDHSSIKDNQLVLGMKLDAEKNSFGRPQGFGTTVTWTRMLDYGKVTANIKSGNISPGVVSSMITMSPEGDEIDFEWVGLDKTEVQSNYYWNRQLDYTKGKHHSLGGDGTADFREYAIEWSPDTINWWVGGKIVRTLKRSDTLDQGTYKFPSTIAKVQFSIWDGGQGLEGTAKWAGTPTDWSDPKKVYEMYIKDIKIECLYPNKTESEWPPPGYGPPTSGKDGKDDKGKGGSGSGSNGSLNGATLTSTPWALIAVVALICSIVVL